MKLFTAVWDRSLRLPLLVFQAKFLFPKDNRLFLKKELKSLFPFRSTLYCPLDDQKPRKKQAFWLKSINNAYYYKSHDKVITNYVSFGHYKYTTAFYYKLRQSSYKLRQVLQITTKLLQFATPLQIMSIINSRAPRAREHSPIPHLRKCGNLPIREILVITWPCLRPPARSPSSPQTYQM